MQFEIFIFVLYFASGIAHEYLSIQTNNAGNIKGKIMTINQKKYSVFLGIPFAKPPVDNLRFKDPEPLGQINGSTVVDASKSFSKTCIQFHYSADHQSEDCLYLNVLSPKVQSADKSRYHVMVWIHGGGFVAGSASDYPVHGTLRNIVSRGVVFVSFNYRLGIFGFFSTKSSAAPGNYGLMDQVQALKWVQENIEFFAGDPTKVTIFGESAGGASVSFLTISPLTKGLFNQAIMMSGSALASWAFVYDGDPDNPNDQLLNYTGCRQTTPKRTDEPKCPYRYLRTPVATANELIQHQNEVECLRTKFDEITSSKATNYAAAIKPRVDGRFLPEHPEILLKNRSPYNILIGVDEEEFAGFEFESFPGVGVGLVLTKDSFYNDSFGISCTHYKHPGLMKLAAQFHYSSQFPTDPSVDAERRFWFNQDVKAESAFLFILPVYQDAIAAINTKSKVYLYSFDYKDAAERYNNETNFYWKGSSHGSELFSLFDSDTIWVFSRNDHPSRRDKHLDAKAADILGRLWTNFAKFGNPSPNNSFDGVKWQPLLEEDSNYLSIQVPDIKMKNNFYKDDIRFWYNFLPQLDAAVDC